MIYLRFMSLNFKGKITEFSRLPGVRLKGCFIQ